MELYRKHRPKTLDEVCGQKTAVAMLRGFLEKGNVPHALMFCGGSGTGKTTMARIVSWELGCEGENDRDFHEINTANFRGIDSIREIQQHCQYLPTNGKAAVWLFDEAHKLLGTSQNAMLKLLEDPPPYAYFMLCTTEPEKLLRTIHTRCTKISLGPLTDEEVRRHLRRILKAEGAQVKSQHLDAVVTSSRGSARLAAVRLEQVLALKDGEELPDFTEEDETSASVAKLLLYGCQWKEMASALKEAQKTKDAESLRYGILGYCQAVLVGDGPKANRAVVLIDIFRQDTLSSGWPGLYATCYQVVRPQ